MKKSKLTLLCIMLIMAITFASVFLVSCNDDNGNDPAKQEAIITASLIQQYKYDGNVHNVQAKLNHDEATLTYSPQQGYTEVGNYEITISAPETKNYNAASLKVLLKIVSNEEKPVDSVMTRWQDLLSDVKEVFSVDKGDVKVNIKTEANLTPNKGDVSKFKFDAVGNLDLANNTDNKTNFHVNFAIDENQYGLYIQNGGTYLKLNDDIFYLNNADIMSLLTQNSSTTTPEDSDSSLVDAIIDLLPLALFSKLDDITNTDGVWTVSLDLTSIWAKVELLVLPIVGKDVLSQENIKFLDDFFNANQMTFKLELDFNTVNSLTAKAQLNIATYGAFKANVTAMEIANGSFDNVEGALTQSQMESAKAINAANAQIQGTLALVNKSGETYEHLNWKLVADIDPFALAQAIKAASESQDTMSWLNDENVRNMKVYFSLYHEHQAGDSVACTDVMCPTRAGGMEDTTILDVAFDPQNFGDSKIYLAANLSRIFSQKSFTTTLQNLNSLINTMAGSKLTGLLNENFFTAIDLTKTIVSSDSEPDEPSNPDDDKLDIKALINPIVDLLTKGLQIQNNAITLDMEQTYALLDSILDLNTLININIENMIKINATNVKDALFKGILSPDDESETDKAFNSISLGITSIEYGNAENFNCKEAITHDPIDASKERAFGGSKPLSLDNANAKTTGRVFNTKQTYDDYTAAGGIHVTLEELNADVVGKLIEYTYTAMDGQTYTAYTQIIAYEGLDTTKLDVPQTIKAIVLPLDGKGGLFSDLLWSILHSLGSGGLIAGFLPSNITIPFRADVIDMQITLTEVESAEFNLNIPLEDEFLLTPYEYDNTAKLDMSKYLGGTIDLVYTDGFKRTITASCSNDLVSDKFLVNDGNEYTITLSHYSMPDIKQDFKVQAKSPEKPSLIINSDGGISVLTYGVTQDLTLEVVVKASSLSSAKEVPSTDYIITIGGKSLDEIVINSDGVEFFELAKNSDDVKINFKQSVAKMTSATAYFSLKYSDGTTSAETRYTKYFTKVAQEAIWASMSGISDLGANLNGKLTYTYWTEEDDEFADARLLSLLFEDGKYYMVDNAENPTVKVEVDLIAYDKNDKSKTNILVDGLIPFEKLQEMSYDSAKKTSKTPSINISATFTVDGAKVTKEKTSQSLSAAYNLTYIYVSKIESDKTFDDLMKFVVLTPNGESHDMRLAYKNGKYVFSDTFEGTKLGDIEVEVVANIALTSSTLGDEITLTDGKLGADQIGNKVTLSVKFTYGGREFSTAVVTNKTVA
ncbi:MAG: hypothetical protein K2L70_05390 [Clostridia bacterium]|nr:hypothetical protein [Clostridia bacterium]